MRLSLGLDVGSSSIKLSLLDIETGRSVASAALPSQEMEIYAPHSGWAEQDPDMWWRYVCDGFALLDKQFSLKEVVAIGITYQMHGLVCLDAQGRPLRRSIIWRDSRAVSIGEKAFHELGRERCLARLLNSPGNFTASKLSWVRENEKELFDKIDTFFLPGDYIAYRLSGEKMTTFGGLSEQMLWDFMNNSVADFVREYFQIPAEMLPCAKQAMGVQCETTKEIEALFGIPKGTPISYRVGDQPNNAFSLNVMNVGEIAATAGTSGVVYGITDQLRADARSRVNPFLHVNHTAEDPRLGVLLCINGTGILNAWMQKNVAPDLTYSQMNDIMQLAPAGCRGLHIIPFGNGVERILENRYTGVDICGLDLNRHSRAHLLRAAQEGIAFSFRYGIDIMQEMGLHASVIRAAQDNMFLSPVFRNTLATLCDVSIELYNTDGALGAARGAAWGAGFYSSREQCFQGLQKVLENPPVPSWRNPLEKAYYAWKKRLEVLLEQNA